MKTKYDNDLDKLIEEHFLRELQVEKDKFRAEGKDNILRIQYENR